MITESRNPAIGTSWSSKPFSVTAEAASEYAAATNDNNPGYGPVCAPMFHVVAIIDLLLNMAADPSLHINMLRLVHGEHAMEFFRLLQPGDLLTFRGTLTDVKQKSSGEVFVFSLEGSVGEELVHRGSTTFFVRSKTPGLKKSAAKTKAPVSSDWEVKQPVTADQSLRYAQASHDHNPIHTNEEVAKLAGLPSIILHGLCTMAFATRDLVNHNGGDPNALQSISARFASPVLMPQTLQMAVIDEPTKSLFTTSSEHGKTVISGYAVFK